MARSIGFTRRGSSLSKLEAVISGIYSTNLAVKPTDKVLIVVDKRKERLGKLFFSVGRKFTSKIELVCIPVGKVNGQEPPLEIAKKMIGFDAQFLITTKSLTHTKARKNACLHGARIATLPDVTEAMLKRAIDIDYGEMLRRIDAICDVLDKGREVRIKSFEGTDMTFSVAGRKAHGRSSGIFTKKGQYGNLPDGESFIAPVEGSANGVFVVDGSIGGTGKVDRKVKVFVKKGYAEEISGGKASFALQKILDSAGKNARNVAEFGIGQNKKAIITGNMLEDEKVIGTCHIALGNNSGFGGKISVPLHIDCLIRKPTIYVDGKAIMERGRFKPKVFI